MKWEKVELDKVCQLITCGVAKRPKYVNDGVPFLSSKNVKENRFLLNDHKFISHEMFEELTKHNKPEFGDILYTRVGSFGEAAVIDFDFDFAIFVSLTLIKPKHNILFNRYLMSFLNSPNVRNFAKGNTRGIGVQNLNVSTVRKFQIPLPPLHIQEQIGEILDTADALRRATAEQLQLLDDLAQSVFLEMFGDVVRNSKKWKIVKFGEVTKSSLGKMVDKKQQTGKHLRKYLRNANVQWNRFNFTDVYEMDFNEKDRKKYKLNYGDILMCEGGEIGRCAIWKNELDNCYYQKALHKIVADKNQISPTYIIYLMINYSEFGGFNTLVTTATIAHLTGIKLKQMEIPLPPLELQNQFAKIIENIEAQKGELKKALADSEDMFDGLLQAVFS